MTATIDYYALLGVAPTANADEIKKAWRRECRVHHPDVADHDAAEEFVRALNAAKETLLNPAKRAEYDALRLSLLAPVEATATHAPEYAYGWAHAPAPAHMHHHHAPPPPAPHTAPAHAPTPPPPPAAAHAAATVVDEPKITDETGPRVFGAPHPAATPGTGAAAAAAAGNTPGSRQRRPPASGPRPGSAPPADGPRPGAEDVADTVAKAATVTERDAETDTVADSPTPTSATTTPESEFGGVHDYLPDEPVTAPKKRGWWRSGR